MTEKLNVGIAGAGRIGRVHAEHLSYRMPGVNLVSVTDIYRKGAEALAADFNVPHVDDDFDTLLQRDEIDAVFICSSTDTHAPFMIAAAEAGKHIFCEKPIAADLAKIDEALAAVEKSGVKLQIGFNRRFDSNYRRVKHAIEQGEIGTPHLMHIISRDPAPPPLEYVKVSGGLFFDMMIHDFDMARYLLGDVDEVYATGGVLVDPAIGEAGDIDTAMVTLKFANGAIGVIDNSRQAVYGYDQRVEVLGSKGAAQTGNNYPNTAIVSTATQIQRDLPLNFFMERYMESYLQEAREFVDVVQNDAPIPVTGADGRAPVVLAMAAKLSLDENRPVKISEVG
ncbi:MAG: inositol 2-dehydrogenase [Aggregatilineales bacterium]